MIATRIASLALAMLAMLAAPARAEDFYRGKTLTLVVGYSAGGGYDINARLIARHLGRHIPGNPTVVVVNMPGAGSLRALEHLEKHAPKDGTVIALFDYTQITNSLLTPDKVPIDFRKFKWIGSVAQDLAVCYVWHTVNAKTVADMQRLPMINMGRTNPGTSSDTQQKVLRKLFKVNVHSVAGYAGSAEGFHRGRARRARRRLHDLGEPAAAWITDNKITPDHARHRRRPRPTCRRACRARFDLLARRPRPQDFARALGRRRSRQTARRANLGAGRSRGHPARSFRRDGERSGVPGRRGKGASARQPDRWAPPP